MSNYTLNYTGEAVDTLLAKVENVLDLVYPIGSIYISANSTPPL